MARLNFTVAALRVAFLISVLGLGVTARAQLNSEGPHYPSPNGGAPIATGEELFASGGDVTVTFLGPTGASFDEELFVASPTNSFGYFFDNHSTPNGETIDLGRYAAGTEIEFGLDVISTGNVWFDGPGSRNADGDVHAYMVNDYEGLANTTYVGFEDEYGSSADWNYVDDLFAFTGTVSAVTAPSVPDAGSTLTLLALGLAGVAASSRRWRRLSALS